MKIKVDVAVEIYGQIEVEAENYEEAAKIVDENFEDYCDFEKWPNTENVLGFVVDTLNIATGCCRRIIMKNNRIWCVIENNSMGDIYEPEFFKSEKEAMDFIKKDATECCGAYYDYSDFKMDFDEEGLCAVVGNSKIRYVWCGFEVTSKIENLYGGM